MIVRTQNPALRHELSFEMGQMHSDTALYFGNNDAGDPIPVLTRGRSNSKTLAGRTEFPTPKHRAALRAANRSVAVKLA